MVSTRTSQYPSPRPAVLLCDQDLGLVGELRHHSQSPPGAERNWPIDKSEIGLGHTITEEDRRSGVGEAGDPHDPCRSRYCLVECSSPARGPEVLVSLGVDQVSSAELKPAQTKCPQVDKCHVPREPDQRHGADLELGARLSAVWAVQRYIAEHGFANRPFPGRRCV